MEDAVPKGGQRRILIWIVLGLVATLVGVVAVFLTVFLSRQPPVKADSLDFEVAKTCLQVAGVTLFGSIVAIATFLFQQEWTQRLENHRRDADRLHDERERQDAALRSMVSQTLDAYNGVKRIRRILRAEGARTIAAGSYRENLLALNDLQLTFEYLKTEAKTMGDEWLAWKGPTSPAQPGLNPEAEYQVIENYLNQLVKEFERNLHLVEQRRKITVTALVTLNSFLTDTQGFRAGVSEPIHRLVLTMQQALLVPLKLPDVG
jgi:ABC-type nickel/cobalt efflux system permease component RcnA